MTLFVPQGAFFQRTQGTQSGPEPAVLQRQPQGAQRREVQDQERLGAREC